jgi:hypothetical protein
MRLLEGVEFGAVGAVLLPLGALVGVVPGVSAVEFVVVVFLPFNDEKSMKPNFIS